MAVRNATKIIASGMLLVMLTGCATASLQQRRAEWSKADDAPVSDTVFEADDSTCQNVAAGKSRGLAIAGISTAAASFVFWPLALVSIPLSISSVVVRSNAKKACMAERGYLPATAADYGAAKEEAKTAAPAVGMKSPTPPPVPMIEDAKPAPAIVTPAPSMKLPVVVNYDEQARGYTKTTDKVVANSIARSPSPATERLSGATPRSTPPEPERHASASPQLTAPPTPQLARTPSEPERNVTVGWLTDATWEGTYRGSRVSIQITDSAPQGVTWLMVARRGSQTIVGKPGRVTVTADGAKLEGHDGTGARVLFVLIREVEMLKGDALVGNDPPEPVSLKRAR
jgi:hypothetical protein